MQSCSRWQLPSSCLSCLISCSTTPGVMCMSSGMSSAGGYIVCMRMTYVIQNIVCRWVCHLHIVCRCVCHLHIICWHICHLHIICSTPHGHHGPKLSFYSDRIWLLNGICHKNVELFHFRII